MNYVGGQTVANNTIAALSGAGQLCVWTYAETDILVDITGWLGPGGASRFTPLGPSRRGRHALWARWRSPGLGRHAPVDLNGVVPAGTTAVALNATAVGASEPAFLTVFPCGPLPDTSTVNYVAGEARPNNTIVGLSGGRFCVYSFAETDVLIDLVGSFGSTGFSYKPTAPTRVIDTRQYRPPLVARRGDRLQRVGPGIGRNSARCCIRQRHCCEPHGARLRHDLRLWGATRHVDAQSAGRPGRGERGDRAARGPPVVRVDVWRRGSDRRPQWLVGAVMYRPATVVV